MTSTTSRGGTAFYPPSSSISAFYPSNARQQLEPYYGGYEPFKTLKTSYPQAGNNFSTLRPQLQTAPKTSDAYGYFEYNRKSPSGFPLPSTNDYMQMMDTFTPSEEHFYVEGMNTSGAIQQAAATNNMDAVQYLHAQQSKKYMMWQTIPTAPVLHAGGGFKRTANHSVEVPKLLNGRLGLNLRGTTVETFYEKEAEAFGWMADDTIVAVNGKTIESFDDFSKLINLIKNDPNPKPIKFDVYRPSKDKDASAGGSLDFSGELEVSSEAKSEPNLQFKVSFKASSALFTKQEYVVVHPDGVVVLRDPTEEKRADIKVGNLAYKTVVTITKTYTSPAGHVYLFMDCRGESEDGLHPRKGPKYGWIRDCRVHAMGEKDILPKRLPAKKKFIMKEPLKRLMENLTTLRKWHGTCTSNETEEEKLHRLKAEAKNAVDGIGSGYDRAIVVQ